MRQTASNGVTFHQATLKQMPRTILIFLCLFQLPVQLIAQGCRNEGYVYDIRLQKISYTVCFDSSRKHVDSLDLFQTNYKIYVPGKKEAYQVDLNFYRSQDSISVHYYESFTGKDSVYGTKLENGGSRILFADLIQNDTTINLIGKYPILFTIPDQATPYITLNHFRVAGDKNLYVEIFSLDTGMYRTHHEIAKRFLLNKKNTHDAGIQQEVDNLIREMNGYLDSVKTMLKLADSMKGSVDKRRRASGKIDLDFEKKVDGIISGSFENEFPSRAIEDTVVHLIFECDEKGKITGIRPSFESHPEDWFLQLFRVQTYPLLLAENFTILSDSTLDTTLTAGFKQKFDLRISSITNEASFSQWNEIKRHKSYISNVLDTISQRKKFYQTEFKYSLSFKATIKKITVKYEKKESKMELTEITKDKKEELPEEIPPKISAKLLAKLSGSRNGKYTFLVRSVRVNGMEAFLDVIPDQKK